MTRHGYSAYSSGTCHCKDCYNAWRAWRKEWEATRQQAVASGALVLRHGLVRTYVTDRCRCEACRAAASEYRAARKAAR